MPNNKRKTPLSKSAKRSQKALAALKTETDLLSREAAEDRANTTPGTIGYRTDEPEQDLGNRLQNARRMAGLTQGKLSERTKLADSKGEGVSRAVISLYENGGSRPGPRELRMLCEVLRVSPSYLIYDSEDPFDRESDYSRYYGWGKSEAELQAYLTYAFGRLHGHPRFAILELMLAVLRGWEKDFDDKAHAEAVPAFLRLADELRLEMAERTRKKK